MSVLPDFYIDRIVTVPSLDTLFSHAKAKARAGGGGLRGYAQVELRGGNAANLAFALSSLTVHTRLYCFGNCIARSLIEKRPRNLHVQFIEGEPGLTVALEYPFRNRRVNIMISDERDLADFDGSSFKRTELQQMSESDCLALVNWSADRRGNELAKRVFSQPSRKKRLNFLDPADLTGAETRLRRLRKIVKAAPIDVLSLNENEASILARFLSLPKLPRKYERDDIVNIAVGVQSALECTVDIHTPIGSASASDMGYDWVSTPRLLTGGVMTGAGDVWDAGDIVGHLMRFDAERRLQFANTCAQLYLLSGTANHPTLAEVQRALPI